MNPSVALQRHDPTAAATLVDELVSLYLDVYNSADPEFFSEDRYRRQLAGHMTAPRWELVTATTETQLVGYIYGFALPAQTRWWRGLCTTVPEGFTTEDGTRTVAISELLVHQQWRRQHIARALHDEFLTQRSEQRATLLVEPDNHPAQTAYHHWGWTTQAQLRPSWPGAPLYDVLTLDLAPSTL